MNRKTIMADIEDGLRSSQMAELALEPVHETGPVKAWFLRKTHNSRPYSVLVLAHIEGITLVGDIAPTDRSVVNARQTLPWFVKSNMEHDYLAGKFLNRGWCEEHAEEHLRDLIEEAMSLTGSFAGGRKKVAHEVAKDLANVIVTEPLRTQFDYREAVCRIMHDYGITDDEVIMPSDSYLHWGVVRLVAIQRTFRRLFWDRYSGFAENGDPILKEGKDG